MTACSLQLAKYSTTREYDLGGPRNEHRNYATPREHAWRHQYITAAAVEQPVTIPSLVCSTIVVWRFMNRYVSTIFSLMDQLAEAHAPRSSRLSGQCKPGSYEHSSGVKRTTTSACGQQRSQPCMRVLSRYQIRYRTGSHPGRTSLDCAQRTHLPPSPTLSHSIVTPDAILDASISISIPSDNRSQPSACSAQTSKFQAGAGRRTWFKLSAYSQVPPLRTTRRRTPE